MVLITPCRALDMARNPAAGISVNHGVRYYSSMFGGWIPDLVREGNDKLIPDWDSIRLFAGQDGHAIVPCCVVETGAPHGQGKNLDPPSILRAIELQADEQGLRFKVGFEIDFILVSLSHTTSSSGTTPEPTFPPCGGCAVSTSLNPSFAVLEESVLALESSGIPVWVSHPNHVKDQYEISLSPASPVQAVHNLIIAIELIKATAAKHGWQATMHPKPFEQGPTTGQHIHLSVCDMSSNRHLGLLMDYALAALLKYMRPLTAFLNAGSDSYRCRESMYGFGVVAWSRGKQALIRRLSNSDDRIELRSPDAMCNPYLQLAAVIGVALRGIQTQVPLDIKPVQLLDGPLPRDQWERYGVKGVLPYSLFESVEALKEECGVFGNILGNEFVCAYIRNRDEDVRAAEEWTFSERRRKIIADI